MTEQMDEQTNRCPYTEFPLVLKSRGPGTSSSIKLGVLFAFQGSPDYYRSFFFFFRVSLFIF